VLGFVYSLFLTPRHGNSDIFCDERQKIFEEPIQEEFIDNFDFTQDSSSTPLVDIICDMCRSGLLKMYGDFKTTVMGS
jgi:hypothetical protein